MPAATPPADIAATLLRLERETFLRCAEWYPELESTNSHALTLAQQPDLELPRVIWAARQTAGRGRGQNAWWSSSGALLMSLLVDPSSAGLPFARWSQVALFTGLAVAETMEEFLPDSLVQLKWPNDVYVAGRKICGVLTEVPPGRTDRLVVGIGINVANSLADAPRELQEFAVSLVDLAGSGAPSPGDILLNLMPRWERWLQRASAGDIDFSQVWKRRCYLAGHEISVTQGDQIVTGHCRGLDVDGVLLLETSGGLARILAGTIRRI
jgi:BirA family biotin operon repressor/biotin-[acetyl-CoA-carboxylase] ligase